MKERPVHVQDLSDGSWRKLPLSAESKHFIYEVIKSKAHILMPPLYSTANNSPAVVIIVPSCY